MDLKLFSKMAFKAYIGVAAIVGSIPFLYLLHALIVPKYEKLPNGYILVTSYLDLSEERVHIRDGWWKVAVPAGVGEVMWCHDVIYGEYKSTTRYEPRLAFAEESNISRRGASTNSLYHSWRGVPTTTNKCLHGLPARAPNVG
ncbi:MAG: hypothetical protein EBZ69_03115 [Alphaproteobacteria bacterium]|nr:hypothetical protein [Alphaproteobacteria bacterium]NDC55792.1 hypothetical protein [Alphaproteobacteria bacterium]NDG04845.1 hypothetical protein [Alphaproteobacteria bacterium]